MSSSNLLLPDLYTGFSRGRSGGLVFPSLSENCRTVQRYCQVHPLRGNPAPRLHCCFLIVPPLSLYPLSSLIQRFEPAPLKLKEGLGGLMKHIFCNQVNHKGLCACAGEPYRILLGFRRKCKFPGPASYTLLYWGVGTRRPSPVSHTSPEEVLTAHPQPSIALP